MTRTVFICAALLALAFAGPAAAAPTLPTVDGSALVAPVPAASAQSRTGWQEAQRQISPQQARAIALSRVPGGEVVDIRRTSGAYRVRIIARDGRVVDIVVDAVTGRIR
ncbi:MAG: PepSY domain-containing protein [Litorimonas sp.]